MPGSRAMFNDEAHAHLETAVCSDRDKSYMEQLVERDDRRLSQIMADQYGDTQNRLTDELASVKRIATEGVETIEDILEARRNGELTASEAAAQLNEAMVDVKRLHHMVQKAPVAEQQAWNEINTTPAGFQRQAAKRLPALFKNGRGLVVLPTFDD